MTGARRRSCCARCSPIRDGARSASPGRARARPRPGTSPRSGTRSSASCSATSATTDEALAHLRRALRARAPRRTRERARRTSRPRWARTLVYAGRTREGLAQLDRAAAQSSTDSPLARVLVRRALVLELHAGALRGQAPPTCARPSTILERSDDDVWRARALHLEGLTRVGLGDLARGARRAFAESMRDPRGPGPAVGRRRRGPQPGVARLPRGRPAPRARALRRRERALRRSST